jgi:drug/metabolite transporter (DMT)-like permease
MPSMSLSERYAPAVALLAAALFGVSTPVAKVLIGGIDPFLLAGLLYLGSGAGLSILLLVRQKSAEGAEAQLKRTDLPWLLGTVFFGGMAGPVLLMTGLSRTSASSASLLLNLESAFTLAGAWIVFHEHVDRRLFAGASAIVAGALLLSWRGGISGFGIGDVLIAGACLSWAIDNNLTRKISSADPVLLAAIKGICAGSVNTVLALWLAAPIPTLPPLLTALLLGFVSYGLGLVLFIIALRHLGTARTGAYYGTAPFIGALAAVTFLHEPVTLPLIAAGILMAVGVWLHLSERHGHVHTHEELVHEHRHVHDEHHQHAHAPDDPPGEPHSHSHRHRPMTHAHRHWPDLHHQHRHN